MAGFTLPAQALDQLETHLRQTADLAEVARVRANQLVLEDIRDRARAHPAWAPMADHIDTWDENDRTWWGIRGPEFESETMVAEYGTDKLPPSGLLRSLDATMLRAAQRAGSEMKLSRGSL